jgi:ATP-dependent Lhr-like helicase
VFERFFDEAGDMHLVIHAPFGARINRAFGLVLRKRFCRAFNFELQAAATEDAIVLSLGETHSFALEDLPRFLNSRSAEAVLVQALLDAPLFATRWRWVATISLAVKRSRAGKKTRRPAAHGGRGSDCGGISGSARVRRESERRARDARSPAGAPDAARLSA